MAAKSKLRWWLLTSQRNILLVVLFGTVIHLNFVSGYSEECANVLTDESIADRDISCNQTCKLYACSTGFELWDNTTRTACNEACYSTFNPQITRVQYCESGCLYAEDNYADQVKSVVGEPSPPRIDDASIQATSVQVDWDEASHSDVRYLLEWRYFHISGDAWMPYHSQPTALSFVTVTDLMPYTAYQFRVQWVITPRHLYSSNPSRHVITDASGVPVTAPIITRLLSPSFSTISVAWQPPAFPSGQLVSYTLSITGPNSGPIRNDVPDTQLSYTFVRLAAATMYTVTIEARNMVGPGPQAVGNVATLAAPNATSAKPYIVAGVTSYNFDSMKQESTISFIELEKFTGSPTIDDVHVVDHESYTIQDVGVHYWKNLVIFSDTSGTIHKREIDVDNFSNGFTTSSDILYQSMSSKIPTIVDVDWLFDHIYFVEDNQILRCDLNCTEIEIAVDGLETTPTDVRVDPYHGYLYWSQLGANGGIYRLDLAEVTADPPPSPKLIIQDNTIKTFVVDSMAFELFYANEASFSIDGAFLDGKEQNTLLPSTPATQSDFVNMTGLVYYNQLFTWTAQTDDINTCFFTIPNSFYTRDDLYMQTGDESFQEIALFVCPEAYHGLDVFHPSYQPYPAPSVPPGNLQVLFVDTEAELTWAAPQRLDATGEGAWQEWLYRIELASPGTGDVILIKGEDGDAIRVTGLEPSTQYSVKVGAYSIGGDGPWSETFNGTTLKTVNGTPYVMFATESAILKVDLDGNNLQTLVPDQLAVRDLDWYGTKVLWVDNSGNIYQIDLAGPSEVTQLPLPQNAESLAVDWLGGVLYWGDLKQHKIFRVSLTADQASADKAYLSDAQDLAIDAVNAYLYWTTAWTLECARLNGQEYFTYARTSDFSGKRIAGLTLDLDMGVVYYFKLSYELGSQQIKLYKADMAGYSANPISTVEEIGTVDSLIAKPAVHYYSQKLFWIDETDTIIISDIEGQNLAKLRPQDQAHAMRIVQSTQQPLPEGFTSPPVVVPSKITSDSVAISGSWDEFNITWTASTEVTYGTVLYEISVDASSGQTFSAILSETNYTIRDIPPYTDLQITMMSYTYWAYTEYITVVRKSPQSVPSVPLNPRVYILEDKDIHNGNSTFSADVRWEMAEKTNGILLGYKVYWEMSAGDLQVVEVGPEINQYTVRSLKPNATYFFKIEGFTEVGSGPSTALLEKSTRAASPPPILFIYLPEGAIQRDVDTQESKSLIGGAIVNAVAMVFTADDEMLYWLDGDEKLKKSPFYEDKIDGLADIKFTKDLGPNSLAINWVTRILYWPEADGIYMYDTTQTAEKVKVVDVDPGSKVIGIGVDPLESALFWTVQSDTTTIMTSDLTGQGKRPFFGPARRRREACTCSSDVTPGSLLVVDLSNPEDGKIYFANGDGSGDIWAADLEGCMCQRVVDAASLTDSGLPPESLSVDSERLYWTNNVLGIVGSVDKTTGGDFLSQSANDVLFAIAFGDNLQPYSDPSCLKPLDYSQPAKLVSSSSDSLMLNLDPAASSPECNGISLATPVYTVYYKMNDTSEEFREQTTSELFVKLTGLDPYTYYTLEVSVANFYSTGDQPRGPVVVYRTGEGVPSAARNLTIQNLTPSSVTAKWTEPADLNGHRDTIRYRIQYSPQGRAEIRYTDFSDVTRNLQTEFEIDINDLTATTSYEFWVQSYPISGNEYSQTDAFIGTTYANPEPVVVIGSTDLTLVVTWHSPKDASVTNHAIEYAYAGSKNENIDPIDRAEWIVALQGDTDNDTVYEVILGDGREGPLRPYTYYHVRTQVTYRSGFNYVYKRNDDIVQTLTTKAGVPGMPLPPVVKEIDVKQVIYDVTWKEPMVNGPGLVTYLLQAAKVDTDGWNTVYKGADLSWRVNLTAKETYKFHVAAVSDLGQGPYSSASDGHFVVQPPPVGNLDIIYAAIGGVVLVILVIIMAFIFVSRSKAANKRKMESSLQVHFTPDQELATLRNMPNSVINRDNTLYVVATAASGSDVELPIFPRERLKLVTFLGSGAFGEVFEGLAGDILGENTGDTRVAVKTLRKGATDEEKDEFLKEAALMGNFQHKNIIALLGVCLDNDPQFIILELMEGGDLLTYLRGARATSATPVRLSPIDLAEIITDVANGCKYLESLKFVHRDLAARNCLVNIKDYAGPSIERSVKIGDFGLARDIYKSDYYRKEGEGLLPVRWMSPEALVDGVFSVQSDVWAFGILMWEVMTLGQQPYPARNNLDVLQYVTAGGRLSRPDNCPDDIHHIMFLCWEQSAAERPAFRYIVRKLEAYKRNSNGGGVDNQGYETSAGLNVKYTKLQNPALDEYLLPIDSRQSLSDPRVPGERKRPPNIDIYPDEDIDQQKAANMNQAANMNLAANVNQAANLNQDSRRKKKEGGSQRGKQSPGAPRRPALDAAVENLRSPGPRDKNLEPRYQAFPPKGSLSKAAGGKVRRTAAPQVTDEGPPLDAPGRPQKQHGLMLDPEGDGVVAAAAHSNDQPPQLHPRRHPNPFRKNSFDESERRQYVNLPDSNISAFANV